MGENQHLASGRMAASLEELEEQIEEALDKLTPKQRKFALIYSEGGKETQEAAKSAGYKGRSAYGNAYRIRKAAMPAIKLLQKKYALQYGASVFDHRSKLETLYELCSTQGSPTWEPRTAHSIRRTLMELDGHIKNTGSSGVNINIELVDPVAGITIDSDTYVDGEVEAQSLPALQPDAD